MYPHLVKYSNQSIFLTFLKYHLKNIKRKPIVINDNHIAVITCQSGLGTKQQSTTPNISNHHRIILFFTPLTSIERNISSIKRTQKRIHETKYSFPRKSFRAKRIYVTKEHTEKNKNLIFCFVIISFFS